MRPTTLAAVPLLLAATAAHAQTNFTTYVSLGDSLAGGFSSGALVETHQMNSVPARIARQAGIRDFQQPLVSEPGLPNAELTLVSLNPVVIAPKSSDRGAPVNDALARPYNNLAFGGATAEDAVSTVDGPRTTRVVLRDLGSQLTQAVSLHPTFVTVWIGDSDVSEAALDGVAIDGQTLTPVDDFRRFYGQLIAGLKATGAQIVAGNIGDPMTIPYVNTIKPYVVDPRTGAPVLVNGQRVPLLGPSGPVSPDSYVTLAGSELLARGVGIPIAQGGTGQALPDEAIVDPDEVAIIRDHLQKDNQAIADVCRQAGIPVVDLHALYDAAAGPGIDVGGIRVSATFLTGGFFSYDALHPTDLGYALMANEWIKVINANGASLPLVDLAPVLGMSRAEGATAAGASSAPVVFTRQAVDAVRALRRSGH